MEDKMVLICVSLKLNINVPELNSHRKCNFINALQKSQGIRIQYESPEADRTVAYFRNLLNKVLYHSTSPLF